MSESNIDIYQEYNDEKIKNVFIDYKLLPIPNRNNLSNNFFKSIEDSELNKKIYNKQDLTNDDVVRIEVKGDGNCFYRVLSTFFYNNENYHLYFRYLIAKYINDNIANEIVNPVVKDAFGNSNNKFLYYINKISENAFWAGDYEISRVVKLNDYPINICMYTLVTKNEYDNIFYYKYYNYYNCDNSNIKNYIIISYESESHYNLLINKYMIQNFQDKIVNNYNKKLKYIYLNYDKKLNQHLNDIFNKKNEKKSEKTNKELDTYNKIFYSKLYENNQIDKSNFGDTCYKKIVLKKNIMKMKKMMIHI